MKESICPMCGRKLDPPDSEYHHINCQKITECINQIEDKRADYTDTKKNSIAEGLQIALDIVKNMFVEEYGGELKL